MKKFIFLSLLAIGMTGCSVESMDSEELVTADAKFKLASTSEMVFLENVCAGEETVITVNFSQRTNPQGKNLPTNIKVDLEVDGVWIEIYQANLNDVTTTSVNYTFADATDYSLRYSAENGPWNDTQVLTVINCIEVSCESGYMFGDTVFKDLDENAKNWGWGNEFDLEPGITERVNIQQKETVLGYVDITLNEDGTVTITEGPNVSITHTYVADTRPTDTAPGQFDLIGNQGDSNRDGKFWVMIKADVCK